MALSIKHPEADRLAREVAQRTGLTLTEAVVVSLREKLERETGRAQATDLLMDLREIAQRCAALPDLDPRTPDEILGYGEHGVW